MPTKEQIISSIQNEKYFTVDEYTTHIVYEIEKLQIRKEKINEKHVKRIIEVVQLYDSEQDMDPVVIVYNGTVPVALIDGNHTLQARNQMGMTKTRIVKVPIEEFGGDEELILRVAAGLNNPEKVSLAMTDTDIKHRISQDLIRETRDYVRTDSYRDQLALDMGRARNGITRMVNTVLKEADVDTDNFEHVTAGELRYFCEAFELSQTSNSERAHNTGIGAAMQVSHENNGAHVTMVVTHRNAITARVETVQEARDIVERFNLPITIEWHPKHDPER